MLNLQYDFKKIVFKVHHIVRYIQLKHVCNIYLLFLQSTQKLMQDSQ